MLSWGYIRMLGCLRDSFPKGSERILRDSVSVSKDSVGASREGIPRNS